MSEPASVAVAHGFVAAFNSRDWSHIVTMLAPTVDYDEKCTGRRLGSPAEVVQLFQGWLAAFPDAIGTVTSTIADGDAVALAITWTGRHTGPLSTPSGVLPASGNPLDLPSAMLLTVRGDQVQAVQHYFDLLTVYQQAAATPAAAMATG